MNVKRNQSQQDMPVTIITGGATGLGFALARHLIGKGERAAILDLDPETLSVAVASLGPGVHGEQTDVTQAEPVQSAVSSVFGLWGRIDNLVNCAGITGKTNCQSHKVKMSSFQNVFEINVYGSMHLFQAVIPVMLKAGYGRILNIASIAGKEGNAGMVAYSASKAAVIGMTKSQGKEYAGTGVTVNALAPAVIFTDMHKTMPEE